MRNTNVKSLTGFCIIWLERDEAYVEEVFPGFESFRFAKDENTGNVCVQHKKNQDKRAFCSQNGSLIW